LSFVHSGHAYHAEHPTPITSAVQRCRCHFSGRVQGVGFRYTTHNIAIQYNVAGYVRNLPDGRVEVVMEGPAEEMDHFIDAIAQRMNGYIRQVDRSAEAATGEFGRFSIRH
jgi:acylphosphatase